AAFGIDRNILILTREEKRGNENQRKHDGQDAKTDSIPLEDFHGFSTGVRRVPSKADCKRRAAATLSILHFRSSRRTLPSIMALSACLLVSRSSTKNTGTFNRPASLAVNSRIFWVVELSVPSILKGRPTMIWVTSYWLTNSPIAIRSFWVPADFKTVRGWAVIPKGSDRATPIRTLPKSSASQRFKKSPSRRCEAPASGPHPPWRRLCRRPGPNQAFRRPRRR